MREMVPEVWQTKPIPAILLVFAPAGMFDMLTLSTHPTDHLRQNAAINTVIFPCYLLKEYNPLTWGPWAVECMARPARPYDPDLGPGSDARDIVFTNVHLRRLGPLEMQLVGAGGERGLLDMWQGWLKQFGFNPTGTPIETMLETAQKMVPSVQKEDDAK